MRRKRRRRRRVRFMTRIKREIKSKEM